MGRRSGRRVRRFPGVQDLGNGTYRIRAEWTCRKTGKRRELDRVIEATSAAAAFAERARLLEETRSGDAAPTERQRLAAFAASWSMGMKPKWAPSTRKTIAEVLDKHVLPVLGDHWLDMMDETDLAGLRDAWAATDATPTTVNTRLRIAKQVLHAARRRGLMPRDICEGVAPLPVPKRDSDADALALTGRELFDLLAEMRRSYASWYPMVCVMAWTGLRFGEASELRWTDMDAEAGTLKVSRAQWHGKVRGPKTAAGVRLLALHADAVAALHQQRVALAAVGRPVLGPSLIFPAQRGGYLWADRIAPVMRDVLRVIGVTRTVDPNHVFRHTMNNLLRRAAGESVRQAMIGHADEASGEAYTDVMLEEKRAAIDAVARMIRGGG